MIISKLAKTIGAEAAQAFTDRHPHVLRVAAGALAVTDGTSFGAATSAASTTSGSIFLMNVDDVILVPEPGQLIMLHPA